jgi:hypothetical protein
MLTKWDDPPNCIYPKPDFHQAENHRVFKKAFVAITQRQIVHLWRRVDDVAGLHCGKSLNILCTSPKDPCMEYLPTLGLF